MKNIPLFSVNKKKDRFELFIFGKKIIFYRYLRMIRETFLYQHFFVLRDTLRDKFNISLPMEAYYHLSGDVELVKIALKEIKVSHKRKKIPLSDTPLFKHLSEGKKYYGDDAEGHIFFTEKEDKYNKFKSLEESLQKYDYDPSKCAIVLRKDNCLIDGYHRSVFMMHKYGENHKVLVVREKS